MLHTKTPWNEWYTSALWQMIVKKNPSTLEDPYVKSGTADMQTCFIFTVLDCCGEDETELESQEWLKVKLSIYIDRSQLRCLRSLIGMPPSGHLTLRFTRHVQLGKDSEVGSGLSREIISVVQSESSLESLQRNWRTFLGDIWASLLSARNLELICVQVSSLSVSLEKF